MASYQELLSIALVAFIVAAVGLVIMFSMNAIRYRNDPLFSGALASTIVGAIVMIVTGVTIMVVYA